MRERDRERYEIISFFVVFAYRWIERTSLRPSRLCLNPWECPQHGDGQERVLSTYNKNLVSTCEEKKRKTTNKDFKNWYPSSLVNKDTLWSTCVHPKEWKSAEQRRRDRKHGV